MGKYDLKKRTTGMVFVCGLYLSVEKAVEYGLRDARARKDLETRYGLVFPLVDVSESEQGELQATQEVMF